MSIASKPSAPARRSWRSRLAPGLAAYLITLLALPVNAAITLPTDPLTTASRVPPNILFILDDSGSMAFTEMENPDITSITATGISNIANNTYVGNTVFYNPALDYKPWVNSSGSQMSGGTSYGAVYGDFNNASGTTLNLASTSCVNYNQNDSADDSSRNTPVCGGVQTFYVPKDTTSTSTTYLANASNYYRYQILTNGTVMRSEWGAFSAANTYTSGTLGTATGTVSSGSYFPAAASPAMSFNVPTGATNLVISSSGGSATGRGADLFARSGNSTVTTANYSYRGIVNGNAETISVTSPAAGNWYVRLYAQTNFTGPVTVSYSFIDPNTGCATTSSGNGWRGCVAVTPTGRSEAAELANYATWFSYHRTRMKAAKAGASSAFSDLGSDVRVGYRTIWGRNGSSTTGNIPTQAIPIPVNYNDGLFSDATYDNRSKWYNRMQSTIGYNGTPLHSALKLAGDYFSSSAASGPYGPATGANQYACRQNFAILTTDGYWNNLSVAINGSTSGNGSVDVGEQDNSAGSRITSPTGEDFTYAPVTPFKSAYSNTLADVAMKYWKTDLRTDLSNIVPKTAANPAFWQHMVTFGISIGLSGNTGFQRVGDVPTTFNGWPNPNDAEDADRIDDLLHAAVNGRGTFLAAGNPTEFADGLKAALAAVTERTGSFSNVASNSTSLDAGTQVFQANYVSGVWTGELYSYSATAAGVSATPSWQASNGIPASGRKVFTSNGTTGLLFPSAATTSQLTALTRTGTTNYPVTGAQNAAYLAGARTLEMQNGGTLRNRNHLLGDIVSSSPAYVKETQTLYVGANDGMLHAINAANGKELFSYIPNGIDWTSLGTLSRPDYSHRYFVDGPIVVSTRTQTPAQNILVGALGKGGKGLYALDVSSPSTFSTSSFKWEITDTNGNMGLVQGKPIIAKLNNGTMALIVSNGINSTNGRAVLLIYNLSTGALIKEIDTGVGSSVTDHADSNGLSAPVGWDIDGSGTVDYVYAGDMLGNVWKFNLSTALASGWGVANSGNPLFTATGGTPAVRQPISSGLTVAMHPTTYETWVFFGTGRFMTTGDATSTSVQSMYGFVDNGSTIVRSGTGANLTRRTTVLAGTVAGKTVRSFEANSPLPSTAKGWYLDLLPPAPGAAEGERIVSDAQMIGDVLITSSIIPTADACQSDGKGYLNALDAFTGTSTGPSFFDLDGDGKFDDETLTSGTSTLPVGSVDLGVGMPTLPNLLRGLAVVGGSAGGTGSVPTRETRNVGRVSWREVLRD